MKSPGGTSKTREKAAKPRADKLALALKGYKEAVEQQAATAEILRALSRSSTDPQPVFEAIVGHAHNLCGALYSILYRYDGAKMSVVADRHISKAASRALRAMYPATPRRDHIVGAAILGGRPVHSTDLPNDPRFPGNRNAYAKLMAGRRRAVAVVPLLRGGEVIGAIATGRAEARPSTKKEIRLLQTFADQAVIAMENARLFNETKEALERQTATADILKVISGSMADVQPVLDALAERTAKLFGAVHSSLFLAQGDILRRMAFWGSRSPYAPGLPIRRTLVNGRAFLDRRAVHVPDIVPLLDSEYPDARENQKRIGFRSLLSVPLIRNGKAIGTIGVWRREVRPFSPQEIGLLETFADQAVIAIENARLFNETKEALEHQKTSADILKIVASSVESTDPVFEAITAAGMRLIPGSRAALLLVQDGQLHYVSHSGVSAERRDAAARFYPLSIKDARTVSAAAAREARIVHVPDIDAAGKEFRGGRELAQVTGFRAVLSVPLLREGKAIGVLAVTREHVGSFSDKQIELTKTFADQAVIAIQNAKFFREIRERNAELNQSLDFQAASGEVLASISSSITDAQPVFDAIVRSLLRLFGTRFAVVQLIRDGQIHLVAAQGDSGFERIGEGYPLLLDEKTLSGTAMVTGRVQQVCPISGNPVAPPTSVEHARKFGGYESAISAPMVREGKVIGALATARRDATPFDEKQVALIRTFADQAVIAIENARLFYETKESLERQTATADILRVISGSPTDIRPALRAVAESAARLCDATDVIIRRVEGEINRAVEHIGPIPLPPEAVAPPITAASAAGRAILERKTIHIHDVTEREVLQEYPESLSRFQRGASFRSLLIVPMLREGNAIGSIVVRREEKRPFSEQQIKLLETFADQAVIAIENVRLFNETKEALERQTATADILKVISGSPTDEKPVFDAVVASASRLFGRTARIRLVEDGRLILRARSDGPVSDGVTDEPLPLDRDSAGGRVALDRAALQIPDTLGSDAPATARKLVEAGGARAVALAPLMRENTVLGVISVTSPEPGALAEKQMALLQTFADQAVIAIENVRLFNETKEGLEQQTAISEVLRVISSSPADVKPVLDAVAARAARICDALDSRIFLVEGESFRHVAGFGNVPMTSMSMALDRGSPSGRAIIDRAPQHIEDILAVPEEEFPRGRENALKGGWRTILSVPLLREGRALGSIVLRRMEVRPFSEKQIALLKTFADQAAIAIENVRLFNETKEALERQTATAEILKVISGSPTDVQPVFEAIVQSAARLFECGAAIQMRDGDRLHLNAMASSRSNETRFEKLQQLYPLPFDPEVSRVSRAMQEGRILEVLDIEVPGAPRSVVAVGRAVGFRAAANAPLLRAGNVIGMLSLTWPDSGHRLDDKQRGMLRTFADQAVIAIENVRLFKELQAQTEALTKSVGQLTALGEVGQAISSTLDLEAVLKTIAAHAVQLTGLDAGAIYEYDEASERFSLQAAENIEEELVKAVRETPVRKGEGAIGQSAVTREPAQVADIQDESYRSGRKEILVRAGYRAILAVPLVREDHLLGALQVFRRTPGAFAPEVVELLKTFATQSAMAIQNARLFREIAEKGRQLEEASQHKSQFLASMSHELRTPLNALLGFNEMLLGDIYGEVPGDMRPPLAQMQSSGKHLLRLINNVLDLAKIESGRMELALAEYSVHDTVEGVRSSLQPLAVDKGLEFRAAVPADIPLAYGDPGRIAQCLMNLAGNSLKFTKAGSVEISVAMDNGLLRYRVADTGIGIPPDKIEGLFTEFKQTDATVASEYGGTGLGLSISRKFVEMHGGRIWAESEPGRGSTFTFEVPLRATAT